LGKLQYFLGIELARYWTNINVSQRKYVLNLLEETGILGAQPIEVPTDSDQKLLENEGELFELSHYHQVVTHIIRYLKRALGLRIMYRPNEHLIIEGFTNVD
jgi:hypothetical protein